MRLTSFTDFGLQVLMRLTGDPERVFTTDEIALGHRRPFRADGSRDSGVAERASARPSSFGCYTGA
ncbi:MAG: hypothetical protein AB7P52_15325 [Alphaproteobacteria bacterium]